MKRHVNRVLLVGGGVGLAAVLVRALFGRWNPFGSDPSTPSAKLEGQSGTVTQSAPIYDTLGMSSVMATLPAGTTFSVQGGNDEMLSVVLSSPLPNGAYDGWIPRALTSLA